VFDYIQRTWGFITPAIVTVFFFGLCFSRVSAQAAVGALLLGPAFYMWCLRSMPEVAFLHHMAFTFVVLSLYILIVSLLSPLREEEVKLQPEDSPSEVSMPWGQFARPRGFIRGFLVPIVTVALGAYWMSVALFDFSWRILVSLFHRWQIGQFPDWLPFVTTFIPVALYAIIGVSLLHLPYPQVRYVLAKNLRPRIGWIRPIRAFVGSLILGSLLGLHVYLFVMFLPNIFGPAVAGYIPGYEQLWKSQIVIDVPVITRADTEGSATLLSLGHLQIGLTPLVLQTMPLIVAAGVGGLFFLGCILLWGMGARPGIQPRPEVELDLTTSRSARFFGLLVILLVGLVYYLFF
jgi:hypothetical protein